MNTKFAFKDLLPNIVCCITDKIGAWSMWRKTTHLTKNSADSLQPFFDDNDVDDHKLEEPQFPKSNFQTRFNGFNKVRA